MYDNLEKKIYLYDLGIKQYETSLCFQEKLMHKIITIKSKINKNIINNLTPLPNHYILFVEHPHIYTLGKNGNLNNLLINKEQLNKIGAKFLITNRGGDITYHGFGQLICYLIIDLEQFKTDINWYIRNLEEVIIKTLLHYNINSDRLSGYTGVWIDIKKKYIRKICSFGIRISRWVTMHGFALNVNTNLQYFDYIIPCGIKYKKVTSIKKELKQHTNLQEIKNKIQDYIEEVFNIKIKKISNNHDVNKLKI